MTKTTTDGGVEEPTPLDFPKNAKMAYTTWTNVCLLEGSKENPLEPYKNYTGHVKSGCG